jgi:predicted Zn finger-like uncharacterized protein
MNYITSCPACETEFMLNKEQLKAHRGKVQCGNCNEVFNAKNRLTEISDDITSTDEYNASIEAEGSQAQNNAAQNNEAQVNQTIIDADEAGAPDAISSEADTPELVTAQANPTEAYAPVTVEADSWESQVDTEITLDAHDDAPIAEKLNDVLDFVPNLANLDSNSPYIGEISPNALDAAAIYDEPPVFLQDLSSEPKFSKDKPKFSFWLLFLCLVFATLAALQATYYYRDRIAAEYPQFKPYLVQACESLQCEVGLPRDLDFFVIDDSDMQEDENRQDVINFTSQLINNASYTQAYPNIELTLTDADDQPALIRLVKPEEYLKTGTDIAAGIGAREQVRVKLGIHASGTPVAGYRVLLVY